MGTARLLLADVKTLPEALAEQGATAVERLADAAETVLALRESFGNAYDRGASAEEMLESYGRMRRSIGEAVAGALEELRSFEAALLAASS